MTKIAVQCGIKCDKLVIDRYVLQKVDINGQKKFTLIFDRLNI